MCGDNVEPVAVYTQNKFRGPRTHDVQTIEGAPFNLLKFLLDSMLQSESRIQGLVCQSKRFWGDAAEYAQPEPY